MKKYYTLPFLAMLFLPFCANRKADAGLSITKSEISLSVERDCLIAGIERRLGALEALPLPKTAKRHPAQNLDAVSASQPVHQK